METAEGPPSAQGSHQPEQSVNTRLQPEVSTTAETPQRSLLSFVTGLLRSVLRRKETTQFSAETHQDADPETRIIQLEARRRDLLSRMGSSDNTGSGVIRDRQVLDAVEAEIGQLKPRNAQAAGDDINNQITDKSA